ncbi:MAG: tetratricopeptide repeat protein [Deltaproteobacteria bacterium]|nr:tetratricopeptide repeat protein [Deltaproteobacteria bacterium]
MIDLYSPTGLWAKQNVGNQNVLDQAFDIVEQELANLVTEKHREAQQTKLVDTYKLARDIYAEYLDKFRNTVNSYKFRFFYAEILFELKEFDKAAEQYGLVISENPKGEFTKPASYTAILAWEKVVSGVEEKLGPKIIETQKGKAKGALKDLEKIEELKKGKEYAASDLTPNEQKLADACDRFVEIAGEDEEVVKVKFKSARLYYVHNQFEEAAKRFGEIIDRWPKEELARIGAKSILESFNVREDWTALNQWSRKFRDKKLLMSEKDFATKVAEFIEGSSFNEIHFLVEPKAEPLEIADRYYAFVKEFPKSKFAMVGLYNSIVNYDKSNLLEKAIDTGEKLLKEYKDFKISAADIEESKREGSKLPDPADLREKVLFLVGSFYERLAEFETAANYDEQYVTEFKTGPKRADAYFNSGVLREGLADFDTALKNFTAYVKEFPNQKDISDINWRMGVILEKKKDNKAALAHFQALSKNGKETAGRKLCAEYKVVKGNLAAHNEREVKAGFESLIRGYQKLSAEEKQQPCALEAVAHAAFVALEPEFNDYLAISLQVKSEKDMAKNLIKKLEMVAKLQTNYTKVLEIGQGDYGIASLYRIGFMYQHLAKAIFDTPCPKKLDEDQCMIYQSELQAKAFPLEEKAIEAFDNALKKAYELGLYNAWLAKAQEALRVYEPLRFPEQRDYDLIASEKVFEVPSLMSAGTAGIR